MARKRPTQNPLTVPVPAEPAGVEKPAAETPQPKRPPARKSGKARRGAASPPASPSGLEGLTASAGANAIIARPTARRLLRLYVARPTPSSGRAETNLAAVLSSLGDRGAGFEIETIDVLRDPHRAIKDRVIVTPCLMLAGANPPQTLIGDLQDQRAVLLFLERAATGGD